MLSAAVQLRQHLVVDEARSTPPPRRARATAPPRLVGQAGRPPRRRSARRRRCPRLELALPVAVEPSARHAGRGRAPPSPRAARPAAPCEALELGGSCCRRCLAVVGEAGHSSACPRRGVRRHARAARRCRWRRRRAAAANSQPSAGACTTPRPGRPSSYERDGDAEDRQAVREVGGAVERIDPAHAGGALLRRRPPSSSTRMRARVGRVQAARRSASSARRSNSVTRSIGPALRRAGWARPCPSASTAAAARAASRRPRSR